jgi:hypothetical protein
MDRMAEYCWRMAAECTQRAEESADPEVRKFFCRMRDNWVSAANREEMLENAGPALSDHREADASLTVSR